MKRLTAIALILLLFLGIAPQVRAETEVVPIYTVEDDTGSLRVLRLQEAINAYKDSQVAHVSDAVYNDMVYGMDRLEKRINPTKE